MEKKVILLNKPVGVTPYQLIQKYRASHPEYDGIKLGFAGRLDPMAEGLLVVLIGEENKNRQKYEKMSKVYTFSCLLGITTDTYDILGIPQPVASYTWNDTLEHKLHQSITTLSKITHQEFPPYSSKPVEGKPLYKWAREGKIHGIDLPSHKVTIKNLTTFKKESMTTEELISYVKKRITPLIGDFRQETILHAWDRLSQENNNQHYTVLNLKLSCSSGTYVRSLVSELGNILGMGAVTISITRTQVGDFHIDNAERA